VAEGSTLEEVAVPASDEVAVLVNSFNEMVRRVRATEAEILASNQELATILGTIPTGVLSIDPPGVRFRPNPAAARMLGEESWMGQWVGLEALERPRLAGLSQRLRASRGREVRFETELDGGDGVRHLEVTVTPAAGGGAVVAMDDLTQLVRAQRLAAWGEVAQRVAHEIKNPLTPIRLAAERIQRRVIDLDDELRSVVGQSCEAIVAHVSGLTALVDAFRDYARLPAVAPRRVDVDRIVREVGALYAGVREEVTVRVDAPDTRVPGFVDPALLRQALVNLVDNAVDAIDGAGEVVLRLSREGGDLVFEVEDTGRGLPVADPETLLLPFYSTKGRGSGMGLALVHRVVTDHGGALQISDRPHGGAGVRISLPGAAAEPRSDGGSVLARVVDEPGSDTNGEVR
jgi:two-component system nitrogen regulation sensor histidine kinase NtrY